MMGKGETSRSKKREEYSQEGIYRSHIREPKSKEGGGAELARGGGGITSFSSS